jgi:hypothetical protein
MSKRGLGARRLVGRLLGRREQRVAAPELSEAERSFRHIWRYLIATGSAVRPRDRNRPNVLVLQMGKVASLAIRQALDEGGVNAFHTHSLSQASQERLFGHLLTSEFTFRLSSHDLRYHVQNVALHMLVRWYQTHRRYGGQRLKVVTLTRDPVTFYISSFIQRRVFVLPDVRAWQRARLAAAAGAELDDAQAVQDFAAELASIIAIAGVDKSDAPVEIAHNRWPDHPVVAQEVKTCLRPLTWFDTEITGIFGLDVLASPELRQRGWVVLENDWVEILALRFEQLSSLVPKIADFAGVPQLSLGERNVTSHKAGASIYKSAIQAAFETPTGQAYIRSLRASAYARACGYDQPTS